MLTHAAKVAGTGKDVVARCLVESPRPSWFERLPRLAAVGTPYAPVGRLGVHTASAIDEQFERIDRGLGRREDLGGPAVSDPTQMSLLREEQQRITLRHQRDDPVGRHARVGSHVEHSDPACGC